MRRQAAQCWVRQVAPRSAVRAVLEGRSAGSDGYGAYVVCVGRHEREGCFTREACDGWFTTLSLQGAIRCRPHLSLELEGEEALTRGADEGAAVGCVAQLSSHGVHPGFREFHVAVERHCEQAHLEERTCTSGRVNTTP